MVVKKATRKGQVSKRSRATVEAVTRGGQSEASRHQRIAERAHQLFEERGAQEGLALDDWLRAEKDVFGEAS